MRILIVTRHFPPEISGGARRPALLAEGLRLLGHQVTVAAPVGAACQDNHEIISLGTFFPQSNSSVVPSRMNKLRSWIVEKIRLPDGERVWAKKAIGTLRIHPSIKLFDIVLTTSPPESVHSIGYALKREFGTIWVADMRDSWLAEPLLKVRTKRGRRFLEFRLARTWLSESDLIVAPTKFILREANKMASGTPTLILPQPVEAELKNQASAKHPKRLVHAGRFTMSDPSGRKIDELLQAFKIAQTNAPELELHLVGKLTEQEKVKAMSTPKVVCCGEMTRPETLDYIKEAGGLIVVARSGTNAVPGKVFEYAVTGRPIIFCGDGPWLDELSISRPLPDLVTQIIGFANKADQVKATIPIHSPKETAQILMDAAHSLQNN